LPPRNLTPPIPPTPSVTSHTQSDSQPACNNKGRSMNGRAENFSLHVRLKGAPPTRIWRKPRQAMRAADASRPSSNAALSRSSNSLLQFSSTRRSQSRPRARGRSGQSCTGDGGADFCSRHLLERFANQFGILLACPLEICHQPSAALGSQSASRRSDLQARGQCALSGVKMG
jgi:hypothetical protein